ncbi:interferon omega-1-like, partial [Sagmatias obliquidens]|uniref:interferon omega-1-like n=1 Tax=Sagmatias obliquidens TaxID=3371155 RepID=UPI000F444F52
MAFVLSLLTALVVFSYGPGGSLGCDLSQNHVRISRKNFMLLGQMRRISPRFCLKDRKDFGFPQDMVDGSQLPKAQATSVLHEMLQQVFRLFHTERSPAAWDTSLLDKLRTGLHQQLEDLDACLVQAMGDEETALGVTGPTLAVKRYFQGSFFISHRLHQAGVQVLQLLMESSAEFVQEGGVPGGRGALCVEEAEDLLEHLVEDRGGLGLRELAAIHHNMFLHVHVVMLQGTT